MDRVIARELVIRGAHGMPSSRYADALALVTSGRVDPGRLIGRRIGLDQVSDEITAMGVFAQHGITVVTAIGAGPGGARALQVGQAGRSDNHEGSTT